MREALRSYVIRLLGSLVLSAGVLASGCGSAAKAPAAGDAAAPAEPAPREPLDDALGGRLYDRFYDGKTFVPDRSETPGVADGQGGPFGNGTLPLSDGSPLLNDQRHDYRLKNFFGWDLRGASGISGPEYKASAIISPVNLLDPGLRLEEIRSLLESGSDTLPGYGGVLSVWELESVLAFIAGVREGRLPHPDQIWSLSSDTPGNYRLVSGADPDQGKALYKERCAHCHGKQGTAMLFDGGEYSLGSHARQKAYEDWFKTLNGQPHTSMKRFVRGESGAELAQEVLAILAALCDRTVFPRGEATGPDVSDGDPRCGDYLR